MTKSQFSAALKIAQSNEDLSNVDDMILDGSALPNFVPVHCTLRQVAKSIRWHCIMLNGEIDSFELNNMANIARKKYLCV